jgi:hypothetical protein
MARVMWKDWRVLAAGGAALAAVAALLFSRRARAASSRPLADRVKIGQLFRANVKDATFDAPEVCLRAVRVTRDPRGLVTFLLGRIEDPRFPGVGSDHAVASGDVVAVTPEGAKACAAPSSVKWLELDGDVIVLRRDMRYRGCVRLPFIVPKSLVRGKLLPGLEAKGFREIVISEELAPSWPPETECDFYVEATWSKADEQLERPGAVAIAWRAS